MKKDEWLDSHGAGDGPVDTICMTVEDYSRDFAPLKPDFLFSLIMEIERQCAVEYIKVTKFVFLKVSVKRKLYLEFSKDVTEIYYVAKLDCNFHMRNIFSANLGEKILFSIA